MTGSRVAAAPAEAEPTLESEVFDVVVVDEVGPGFAFWLLWLLTTVDELIVGVVVERSDRSFVANSGEASSAASGSRSSASATGDKGGETGGDRKPPEDEDDETIDPIEEADVCRESGGGIPPVTIEEEEGEEEEEELERIEEGVRDREAPPPGEEGEKYFPRKDEANQDWRRVLR